MVMNIHCTTHLVQTRNWCFFANWAGIWCDEQRRSPPKLVPLMGTFYHTGGLGLNCKRKAGKTGNLLLVFTVLHFVYRDIPN